MQNSHKLQKLLFNNGFSSYLSVAIVLACEHVAKYPDPDLESSMGTNMMDALKDYFLN